MQNSSQRVMLSKDVLIRQVGSEAVLLNLKTSQYFALNPVGVRMVQALTQTESIDQALTILLDEYEVDPAELCSDLEELVESLLKQSLVKVL